MRPRRNLGAFLFVPSRYFLIGVNKAANPPVTGRTLRDFFCRIFALASFAPKYGTRSSLSFPEPSCFGTSRNPFSALVAITSLPSSKPQARQFQTSKRARGRRKARPKRTTCRPCLFSCAHPMRDRKLAGSVVLDRSIAADRSPVGPLAALVARLLVFDKFAGFARDFGVRH